MFLNCSSQLTESKIFLRRQDSLHDYRGSHHQGMLLSGPTQRQVMENVFKEFQPYFLWVLTITFELSNDSTIFLHFYGQCDEKNQNVSVSHCRTHRLRQVKRYFNTRSQLQMFSTKRLRRPWQDQRTTTVCEGRLPLNNFTLDPLCKLCLEHSEAQTLLVGRVAQRSSFLHQRLSGSTCWKLLFFYSSSKACFKSGDALKLERGIRLFKQTF